MCKQHTLVPSSKSKYHCCVDVCLHVSAQACVFIRVSDTLATRILPIRWSAAAREGNAYHQMILFSSLPFLVKK